MAYPRRTVKGATYLITRRCRQRRMLLAPDSDGITWQVMVFCLGWAASKYGVKIHAVCVLGNHVHILLTDPRGLISKFMHWLFLNVARCMNAWHRDKENFWGGRPSVVVLADKARIIESAGYVLANPVAAGLVETPGAWPGLISSAEDWLGRGAGSASATSSYTAKRPGWFFVGGKEAVVGEDATLRIVPPPWVDRADADAVAKAAEQLRDEVDRVCGEHRATMAARGWSFKGAQACVDVPREDKAKSTEAFGELDPTFAARCRELRKAMAAATMRWREQYREAKAAWLDGYKRVVFPNGTQLLATYPGTRVDRIVPLAFAVPW